jgi:hypothetical protein
MIVWSFFSRFFSKKKPQPELQQKPESPWTDNETTFKVGQPWSRPLPAVDIPSTALPTDIAPPIPPYDPALNLWERCMRHMRSKGMVIDSQIGGGNIIFVSGYGLNGTPNDDRPNIWNDLVFVARNTAVGWTIPFAAECTTSPGSAPSLAKDALERGGIACIVPGQYFAWMLGYHKEAVYGKSHPAFVQRKVVSYTRDFNQDLSPAGDKVHSGVIGANIHAQGEGKDGENVNYNSEGCLVLRLFAKLQELRFLVKDFNSYKENGRSTIFAGTIIKGSDLPD